MLLTPDTSLARICTAALPGKCTVEQIAEKADCGPLALHPGCRMQCGPRA